MGFTFSFPCQQEGLAKATLVKWTKGFNCSGVEGEDVVRLLQEAIERRSDVKIQVCAILNDTTGCLMSCAWRDERCRIGLILGTGTNACYLEEIKDIHTIDQEAFTQQRHMIINTEWGAFGDNGELDFVRTKWDINVDANSVNPGKYLAIYSFLSVQKSAQFALKMSSLIFLIGFTSGCSVTRVGFFCQKK